MNGYSVKPLIYPRHLLCVLTLSLYFPVAGQLVSLDTNDVLPAVRKVIDGNKLHKLGTGYTAGFVAHAVLRASEHIDLGEEVGDIQVSYQEYADGKDPKYDRCVDNLAFGCSLFDLYRITQDDNWLTAAKKCSDYQINNLTSRGGVDSLLGCTRFWVDDMAMIGVLQAAAYRATGEQVYADWLGRELNAYLEHEIHRESGLFWHTSGAPHYWGRGNGWAAAGLAEALLVLPEENEHYAAILSGYLDQMNALLDLQHESGMWGQILDHPESFLESSGTALFCFALATGIRKGWFDNPQPYKAALEKAWMTLSTEYVDDEGRVLDVVGGTGPSGDVNAYLDREPDDGNNHGTCAFLWAGMALIELLDQEETSICPQPPSHNPTRPMIISPNGTASRTLDMRGRALKTVSAKGMGIIDDKKVTITFTSETGNNVRTKGKQHGN